MKWIRVQRGVAHCGEGKARNGAYAMHGAKRSEAEWSVAPGMCAKQTRGSGKGNVNSGDDVAVARDLARTQTEKPCSRTNPN